MNNLLNYLTDKEKFSTEHFIINNSGKFKLPEFNIFINYPNDIKKYANSIFNFIFIARELNNELGDNPLYEKIRIINEKMEEDAEIIDCDYSIMIINKCKVHFTEPQKYPEGQKKEATQAMESYYEDYFVNEFSDFAFEVIQEIGSRLGV